MNYYIFFLIITSAQNMQTGLEHSINSFITSEELVKYYYDNDFSEDEISQFVEKNNASLIDELSSNYYEVYKINSNLYIFNYRSYGMFALFKELETVKSEIEEVIKSDGIEYDKDIVQYSLKRFEPSLLHNTTAIQNNLVERFSSDKLALDYSTGSLNYLDKIIENNTINSEFIKQNLLDISFYIGTIYINKKGGRWKINDFQEGLKLPIIISKDGKTINIVKTVYNALIQEHGALINPSDIYRIITNNMFKLDNNKHSY